MTGKRFPIGLTLATAISLAILIGLGGWQLKRLAWKTDLLASITAAQALPPAPITTVPLTHAYQFRRVVLDCPGLATAPYIELYAIRDGGAGVRLVSLCSPVGARTQIMVDRGFVADTVSARPAVKPSTAVVHLVGVLREGEKPGFVTPPTVNNLFYIRDIRPMALALGAPRHPDVMVLAETSTKEIAQQRDAQGLHENSRAAADGGGIAGSARKQIEQQTGKTVVSPQNFLGKAARTADPHLLTRKSKEK